MDRIIYRRLLSFYRNFKADECPFGNSGHTSNHRRNEIEDRRYEKFFIPYGKCEGLCVKLKFVSKAASCPCMEHGPVDSREILKKWLKSWEKIHPGDKATTRSGKPKRNDTTTKTPKTTIKATKGTPKKK